jgi:hypothetical protein
MSMPDEMGWSWWDSLQQFAESRLGPQGSRHIRAVHAWHGVYVDAEIERELLWPRGKSATPGSGPKIITASMSQPKTLWSRLRSVFVKPAPSAEIDSKMRQAMDAMIEKFTPPTAEREALEVSSLRGVVLEARALLDSLSISAEDATVHALWESYAKDDARCDEDPHIQCLCHLWLTGNHALTNAQPMWLVK